MEVTLEQGKQALSEFINNYHTGIDLASHPTPNNVQVTDEALHEFASSLQLTSSELQRMKSVAQKVIAESIQSLSNASQIGKIVISECHLSNCGRNDSGLDIVVLFRQSEDLKITAAALRKNVHAMTSASIGRKAGEAVPEPLASTVTHPEHTFHFELQDIHVNLAVGHRYGVSEEANRNAIWQKIDELDQKNLLKKTHLDQFSIELYESMTLFMNNQVAPEGANTESEQFLQGALRLARAWRQCTLSSRDIQFAPLDAWLVMLHAVHLEISKHPQHKVSHPTVSGIKSKLRTLFKGVTGKTLAPSGFSMKNVMRNFLVELQNLDQMNITFSDFYDSNRIPDWIKPQRPLILDPVCPSRNTVYNLHKRVDEDIKTHAAECVKMLDDPSTTMPKLFHYAAYKKRGA
jgi:hypothetical protein